MSLRAGDLEPEDRKEALIMILISMTLSVISVLFFVLFLRLNGFTISLSELYRYAFAELFTNSRDFVKVLYWATPLIMTGLAVAIAFQAGLFNIGGQGQMVIGGAATGIFAASIAPGLGLNIFDHALIMIPICLFIGFVFGFIWGFIPGWLKAKTGAHEVIVTIMMNFIATSAVTYLVGSQTFSPYVDRSSVDAYGQTERMVESARIPLVFPDVSNFFNYSFFYAIIVVIILQILIYKTNAGFKIRAVGYNESAARASGINTHRVITMSMGLSGGVAGLGGAFYSMGSFPYRFIIGAEGTLGFDGIAVALIGQNNPISIIFAALIFGFLAQSKGNLDVNTDIPPDLIFVFQGLVILFAAAPLLARRFYQMSLSRENIIASIANFFESTGNFILNIGKSAKRIGQQLGRQFRSFVSMLDTIKLSGLFRRKTEEIDQIEEHVKEPGTGGDLTILQYIWGNTFLRTLIKVFLFFEFIIFVLWTLNGLFGIWLVPTIFHERFWNVILETNTFKNMLIASVPIMLTAMGATFNERVGIINIGLEGIMIWGAWTSVYFTVVTGNYWTGIIAGVIVGALMGLLHAFFSITLKAEQIVTGVAINLLALGMTEVLSNLVYGQNFQLIGRWKRINIYEIPLLGPILEYLKFENHYETPVIGGLLQQLPDIINALNLHHPLIYISLVLILICHLLLFRTSYGLRMRVIGEHPQAAATAGINVKLYQYIAVIFSGAMAGLGGATLAMNISAYRENVVGGRGFIALAAMIFGKWTVIGAALASMFFGYFVTLQIRLGISIEKFEVPNPFLQMIPFIVSIMALAGFIGRARPPKHIGEPYDPTQD